MGHNGAILRLRDPVGNGTVKKAQHIELCNVLEGCGCCGGLLGRQVARISGSGVTLGPLGSMSEANSRPLRLSRDVLAAISGYLKPSHDLRAGSGYGLEELILDVSRIHTSPSSNDAQAS